MSKQPQSASWCFTQFVKFNERDQEYVPRILWNEEAMVYLIYQLEECPKSGRLHWQGYIQFKNRVRMQRVKQLLDLDNVHLEIARGDDVQNRFYCSYLSNNTNNVSLSIRSGLKSSRIIVF